MKTVILAGGLGTRLSELTSTVPKPMVSVGGIPIIHHIMEIYASQGFNEFIVALGYKGEIIKEYFYNLAIKSNDFTIDMASGAIEYHSKKLPDYRVTLVDTGNNTMTGGRIKALAPFLQSRFMITYGDGLGNINIQKLLAQHVSSKSVLTITSVHPRSKYGKLIIDDDNKISSFIEKPEFGGDWINAGFMVAEPSLFNYLPASSTVLESTPMEQLAEEGLLSAYRHHEFWQCMDTLRDKNLLDHLAQQDLVPWKV